ncbi:MAG: phosphatidylcholine/phosphatidylserine synthase [Hyphomicrobiales bacterium]|nr:phosphatidylcholine/phosphatidylserine synthase [Hyphomicrobiales bacterium]
MRILAHGFAVLFGLSKNALWAFGVHILTASGAFFAFLAMVAAAEFRFPEMFLWMGVALLVDGVDGPLARKLEVKKWWPYWSGEMLDAVIDYFTYVMLPAFALYQSGLMGRYASFTCAAIIVITSAIYYADTRMKSRDYGFIGFPVTWNMVVFSLFIVSPGPIFSMAVVVITAVLTFVPVIFVHPVRVKVWRTLTLSVLIAWSISGAIGIWYDLDAPFIVDVIIVATSIYLFCIGFLLQLLGELQ